MLYVQLSVMQMINMIREKCLLLVKIRLPFLLLSISEIVQFIWYIWIGENHRLLFSYSITEDIVLKMTIIIHISGFHLCKMAPLHVRN